jgi:transposase, IS30 family
VTYQAIYVQGRGGLRRELAAWVRNGQSVPKPPTRQPQRPDVIEISEHPPGAEDWAVPGHWEGDLVFGHANRSVIGTLVERSTRFVLLLHLPDGHDAGRVRDAMIDAIQTLSTQLRRSFAWEHDGKAVQTEITMATDMAIYFCDPKTPWRPGTGENTNGLLRQYFPKGTDLSTHTPDHLNAVAAQLNGRPRQTLGWLTPVESLNRVLAGQSPTATTG